MAADYCRYCGSPIEKGSRTCPQCQNDLTADLGLSGSSVYASPESGTLEGILVGCPKCGAKSAITAESCPECGLRFGHRHVPSSPTICRRCTHLIGIDEAYCAHCGTRYEVAYAGFWRRTGGYLLDALILLVPNALARLTVPYVGDLLVDLVYFTAFWTTSGQTLGMRAVGVRVQDVSGDRVSLAAALGRYVMLIVGFACLLLGVAWVGWQREKRGWHDLAAGTEVVRT